MKLCSHVLVRTDMRSHAHGAHAKLREFREQTRDKCRTEICSILFTISLKQKTAICQLHTRSGRSEVLVVAHSSNALISQYDCLNMEPLCVCNALSPSARVHDAHRVHTTPTALHKHMAVHSTRAADCAALRLHELSCKRHADSFSHANITGCSPRCSHKCTRSQVTVRIFCASLPLSNRVNTPDPPTYMQNHRHASL